MFMCFLPIEMGNWRCLGALSLCIRMKIPYIRLGFE